MKIGFMLLGIGGSKIKTISTFLFFLIAFAPGYGQVTNLSAGLWSDSTLWSNNHIPTVADSVYLTYDVIIDTNINCKALNANGHSITINSGLTFNVIGNSNVLFDIDNNVYHTVTIGSQVWMKENLKVTRYRNADTIPQVQDSSQWVNLTTGAWCYYNDHPNNYPVAGSIYGKYYNWYTLNDPRGLAPQGWHVPSDSEWNVLSTYLGGDSISGGKMKDTGTVYWNSPNLATNSSGFTALPSGFRIYNGINATFYNQKITAYWWSSTRHLPTSVYVYTPYIIYGRTDLTRDVSNHLKAGMVIRCVKD